VGREYKTTNEFGVGRYVSRMDLSFEEAAIITKAIQDVEGRLGKQSELITRQRSLIERLNAAGFLHQNADQYSLKAKGRRAFKHLMGDWTNHAVQPTDGRRNESPA
jgi:hypothetical protein